MQPGARGVLLVGLSAALSVWVTGSAAAARDFPSVRREVSAEAEKLHGGARLWRIDAPVSYAGAAPEITDYSFYYVYGKPPLFSSMVLGAGPQGVVEQGRGALTNVSIEPWQITPVPRTIISPEEALRILHKNAPPPNVAQQPRGRSQVTLRLVYAGPELARTDRNQHQRSSLARTMGLQVGNVQYFARTAPAGKWVWWIVFGLDRPDPRTDPRRAGTPARLSQYFYIDAVSGALESHCVGPVSGPVPCDAAPVVATTGSSVAAPPAAPGRERRPESGQAGMATGAVKDASGGHLVIVTDRDASGSSPKGTEMAFVVIDPHLRRMRLQSGDRVSVHYQVRGGGQLVVTEIKLRPPE
jgi:hypothetical protein